FGEHFSRWISQLPDWVHVDLDGELQTLTASAVSGSVRLEAQEVDRDWFDLRVVVDVQETFLTPEEIQILLKARGALTRLEGKGWRRLRFDVSEAEDQQMARIGLNPADLDDAPQRLHVLQLADPAAERFLPAEQVALVRRRAEELQARVTPDVPAGISAPLRPYQVEGFHFLAYLSANRFGGILADDMGLGKTLQTLSWILWLRGRSPEEAGRPSLVVCPKSVMENWRSEAAKFAPALRVRVMSSGESVFENVGAADLHVMNYAHLRLLGDRLTEVRWLAVILDEGQFIKNPDSQSAVAARGLPADHRLVLTGTPIENRLMDLWSLMAFAMPGMLPSRGRFGRLYNAQRDPLARRRLSARVRPFLLRRTKGQVARDLPEKIEETILCELEGEQKLLYNAEFKRGQQLLLNLKTQKQLAKEQFQFLSSLLRLRQICCSPKLVNPATPEQGAKLEGLLELLESLLEEGHKVLVFSQFVSMLELIRSALEEQGLSPYYLTGETEDRGTLVDRFQADPNPGVFLISLRAGGFGLNLTSASYVVLFDPWWNPAVEAQAIDRTHRIGQQSTVVAYRFLIKGSVEEKMRELQRSKSSLAEQVLGEEKFSQSLTLEDLRFLYS
ncbi:MAG TPA: serine/threonine protein phosphatase, partial [Verrucomicrobiales bacterium]|nr:serine/threonine protein phosphatase [Verrucomicrobiales bacterium]